MAIIYDYNTGKPLLPGQEQSKYNIKTGQRIGTNEFSPDAVARGALSGTGTPAPGAAPVLPQDSTNKVGSLTTFADALNEAVNIARQKRNQASMDIAEPYIGTVGAGSFADIVGALNKSSENRLSDISKKVSPDASSVLTTTNDKGVVTGIDKATGKVLWQTEAGVGNEQGNSDKGSLLALFSDAFTPKYLLNGIPTVDSDGFITPEAWSAAINDAVSMGITRSDFIKQFGHMILNLGGEVSPKYGLTPVEVRLILGESGAGNPW